MTCQAHLHGGNLCCVRPLGHAHGHAFAASSAPQLHDTEPKGHADG